MTTRKTHIVAGKKAVQDRIPGINRVTATLANGREAVYFYHRATGTKLPGAYGSDEFLKALADAKAGAAKRHTAGLRGHSQVAPAGGEYQEGIPARLQILGRQVWRLAHPGCCRSEFPPGRARVARRVF